MRDRVQFPPIAGWINQPKTARQIPRMPTKHHQQPMMVSVDMALALGACMALLILAIEGFIEIIWRCE